MGIPCHPQFRRLSAARGFTLVELLIALAIVYLIMVLLFDGLRVGTRS